MAKIFVFIVCLLSTLMCSLATLPIFEVGQDQQQESTSPLARLLSQRLVDVISEKLHNLAAVLKLKLRLVRFVASLYTDENLRLLRDLIGHGVTFANYFLRFLPISTEDAGYGWILILSDILRAGVGQSENDLTSEENQTDPPIGYNAKIEDKMASLGKLINAK